MTDVIITSYKRWDLLRRTLNTFIKYCDFDCNIIVYEDYGLDNMKPLEKEEFDFLSEAYPNVIFVAGHERLGQVKALDILMSLVKSKYYLKLEDDWDCVKRGYLEEATKIMDNNTDCICVWLRGIAKDDINSHPIKEENGLIKFETEYAWRGFSWGASLHRLSDYEAIKPYSNHTFFFPRKPFLSEKAIGELYYRKGFFAATLKEQYFVHTGGDKGIRK